jgi:diacylglycerol kinase (ATP)
MTVDSHRETIDLTRRLAIVPRAEARHVLISVNPRAGSRSRHEHVGDIERVLAATGFQPHVSTELEELIERAAAEWNAGRLRAVVAVGGDGTASFVRSRLPLEIPMMALPLGTENLLARYLDQSAAATSVRETLELGVTVELDLGRADGRMFLLMISAGFDAEVIRRLHVGRTGNITRRSYVLPTLGTIYGYRYPELQLYCGDAESLGEPKRCRSIFAFNLPLYALRLPFAPQAVGTDGMLDVCAFGRGGLWSMSRYLWHVARGKHAGLNDVSALRVRRFRLEADGVPDVAYQLDGDIGGTLPVDVDVLPGQLRLFVSCETARRLGFEVPTARVAALEAGVNADSRT